MSGTIHHTKLAGTIHRTILADRILETPKYEQVKYPGLVYLKVILKIYKIDEFEKRFAGRLIPLLSQPKFLDPPLHLIYPDSIGGCCPPPIKYTYHEFHETFHSVTFYFLIKDSKRCCDTTTPKSIHTKDESKRGSAFAFIFGVN